MSNKQSKTLVELLKEFKFERVLSTNPETKITSLLGEIDGKFAIVTVEKAHFLFDETIHKQAISDEDNESNLTCLNGGNGSDGEDKCIYVVTENDLDAHLKRELDIKNRAREEIFNDKKFSSADYSCDNEYSCVNGIQKLKQLGNNDGYHWGLIVTKQSLEQNPTAKISVIWPASYVHIRMFDQQSLHVFSETPELYERIVKPYIQEMSTYDKLSWVYDILYGDVDPNRVVYKDYDETKKDEGFVVLPDSRWDGINVDYLCLVVILYRDDIKTLRDLKPEHRDMLIRLNRKLRSVIPACYNYMISPDLLRVVLHYQPSYYHFHLHVVNIKHPALGADLNGGREALLEDIIDVLPLMGPEGWSSSTITYFIGEHHDLWKRGLKEEVERQSAEASSQNHLEEISNEHS